MARDREPGREILPVPDRPIPGFITYDAKDPETSFPPITQLRPPEDAPNARPLLGPLLIFARISAWRFLLRQLPPLPTPQYGVPQKLGRCVSRFKLAGGQLGICARIGPN